MKKPRKPFWIFLTTLFVVGLCITGAILIGGTFQEISRGDRYEYDDFFPLSFEMPTPVPLNTQLNNDLTDLVLRYRKGQISVMDISAITPFEWDRVHIFSDFPEFMNYKDIDRILGRSWSDIDSCDYAVMSTAAHDNSGNVYGLGYSLFIFTHESTVVYCLFYKDIPNAHLYINSADTERGIPRENALFIIDKQEIIRPIRK